MLSKLAANSWSESNSASLHQTQGASIVCLHCGFDRFWQRRAKLNSAASEFFDLAWASEESLVLTCTMCGSMREFLPRGVTTTPVN